MMNNKNCENKTVLYIVRHGESLGNMTRRFLGHTDLDLSERGVSQAEATAGELCDINFSAIYSSDLIRAYNTAMPHSKLHEVEIITDSRLRELYCGEWENMYIEDIIEKYGSKYTKSWKEFFGEFQSPGGESVPDLAKRIYDTVTEIARRHRGQTVLITTHAAAIRSFWGVISEIPPAILASQFPFPTNASYSVVEYSDGKLIPVSYSNDAHLSGI